MMPGDANLPAITLDDLYALDRIREAKLLPNGAGVVFVVSHSDKDVEKREVRIVAADGSSVRTIARGLDICAGVSPAPDGSTLALLAVVDGKLQACLMDIETGAIRPVTALKQGIGTPPVWSPCGEYLAFTAIGEERLPKGKFDPIRTSSLFYKLDGAGFADRVVQDIFVVAARWNTVTRLTHGPHSHQGINWSPVPGRLELCFGKRGGGDALDPTAGVGIVDLAGNSRWVIENDPEQILGFGFAGDGERLLITAARPDKAPGTSTLVWTVAVADGRRECRTAAFCAATGGTFTPATLFTTMPLGTGTPLSPAGSDAAVVIGTVAGRTAVYRVALSGPESCQPLTPTNSGHFLIDADARHILWFHSDHNTPADLWIANADGSDPRRLTTLHDAALARHPRPSTEHLTYAAADGTPLDAWLVLPAGTSGPVPMVLDIHGGPQCAWGPGFWHFAQALAARGIATLMPNPRGSASFGDEFAAAIQGSFARPADSDVLAAVDAAVAQGFADPDRLGLAGISYGGYLSAWLLGQTTRFKAAIPEQLISNLISMHGTSDAGREIIISRFKTSIATGHATIWDNSPLAHAHRATTPTLIIQCENDVRCPMGQAEEFFVALREAGCTTSFLRIPGSAHAGPQLAGIAALSRVRDEPALDWFTRHLLPA